MANETFTITFGERAENHVGMQQLGAELFDNGITREQIYQYYQRFKEAGCQCRLVRLHTLIDVENPPKAYILVVRNGANYLLNDEEGANKLFAEEKEIEYDSKAYMYGRVVNKHARHNVCFDEEAQEPDYQDKKGRVIAYQQVPVLKKFRRRLIRFLGEGMPELVGEGNHYYDVTKCGIGFHGDSERKVVIALRLGATMPIHYQWYFDSEPVGTRKIINLHHGDIYFMSEKATGNDWKQKKIHTLRHAAGSDKYTN